MALLAGCPFASDRVRDEWLKVTAPTAERVGTPTPEQEALLAHKQYRKQRILKEASPEVRAVLERALRLQREARRLQREAKFRREQAAKARAGEHSTAVEASKGPQ